MIEKTGL